MASHHRRPFQWPPLSLRPPSSAENPPFSGTRVPMDEMNSSNPVNVFGSMSSDQAKRVHPDKNPSDPLAAEGFQAHPGASQLRYKPIRNYDKLSILLGKDRATGSLAVGAKERQLRWAQEQNLDGTNPLGSSQHGIRDETFSYVENEATTETSFSSADASVSAPKSNKETKKRKEKYADIVSEKLRSIRVGMDAVVAAFDRSNPQNYTEEQLFEEIAKIGGMSDVSHMKAYQALTSDVSAARAFLACPIDRPTEQSTEFSLIASGG
eukprot:XP_019075333.1 PREDICTED: uncharacterized protein LOC100253062 [Vitis vinifera]